MYFVFDIYGTLLNTHSIMNAGQVSAYRKSIDIPWNDFSASWRERQLRYSWLYTLTGSYVTFWEITKIALQDTMQEFEIDPSEAFEDTLMNGYNNLSPFEDVPEFLKTLLDKDSALAVLSNGDERMIKEGLKNALLIDYFKYILTVDDIKKFKPDQEVYKLAPIAFNCEPNEITFFSSNNWGISGANKFGFKTIWVNRGQILSEQLPGSPDYEVQTLTEALNFIEV